MDLLVRDSDVRLGWLSGRADQSCRGPGLIRCQAIYFHSVYNHVHSYYPTTLQ